MNGISDQKNTSFLDTMLLPFKYISIGFITVITKIVAFFKYMCLGAYYIILYLFLKPIFGIKETVENIFFSLFAPKMKKDKALKIEVNYDEKGEKIESKTVFNATDKAKKAVSKKKKSEVKVNPQIKARLDAERAELLKMLTAGQDERLEKPQVFRYKAMGKDGKMITDIFKGVSKMDIYTFLTSEGYTVYSIETSEWLNNLYNSSMLPTMKFNTKDLIFFITQLATYIKAGITLTEAMRILSVQLNKNKRQHRVMQSIVYYLTMGESFSRSLERQGDTFPQLVINMIKAAEAAGNLEEALEDLGNYYTELDSTRKQMRSAMTYPAFVGLFSLIVVIVIMTKIIPQFVGIYSSAGAELNPLTLFIISASAFMQKYITYIILLFVAIIITILALYKKVQPFRRSMQTFMMKIPVVGKIIIYNELTIFTKTFASLLRNEVFITDSMEILSKLTNNEIYKEIMVDTVENISKGGKISETFNDHWAIPDIAYYMIVTGENTGQLANMMSKVSTYYQEQHASMINSLKSLIEPVMIVFLAVVVGGILIAVILPMFQLYNNIT